MLVGVSVVGVVTCLVQLTRRLFILDGNKTVTATFAQNYVYFDG